MQAILDGDESAAMHESSQQAGSEQQERWQQVASLLGRKHDRIDPVQALPLLPTQVSRHFLVFPLHVPPLSYAMATCNGQVLKSHQSRVANPGCSFGQ